MNIKRLELNNFRCFEHFSLSFDNSMVLIEGNNGSGKTSLLEALYYACYLRSFRTRTSKELIQFENSHFFINVNLTSDDAEEETIEIGFEHNEKRVKRNSKIVSSYKDIIDHYRIVSLCSDDLSLIQGPPEQRRSFVDQSIFLDYPDFMASLRTYKSILHQRNSFLLNAHSFSRSFHEQLKIWSEQLWTAAYEIQQRRIEYMATLEEIINTLIDTYFPSPTSRFSVAFKYHAKGKSHVSLFDTFWKQHEQSLLPEELKYRRSLFGIHLDDISITLRSKQAKFYASRGQQKLVAFLLKCAHIIALKNHGKSSCIVLDDFLTDFDPHVISQCLKILLSLETQCFITSPLNSFFSLDNLSFSPQIVIL